MNDQPEPDLKQIDQLCDEFECAWQAGQTPCIEDRLSAAPVHLRSQLLLELLKLETHYREQNGEAVARADYASRFPDHAHVLNVLFGSGRAGSSQIPLDSTQVYHSENHSNLESKALPNGKGTRYQALRSHAKGGLGEVFLARDTELDRQVALKEIQERYAGDPGSRSRFVMEAEVTGKLEHPGIVPVYGLGSYSDGRPFYAMKFIRGESLQQSVLKFHEHSKSGKLGPGNPFESVAFRKLLGRFVDVCQAVSFAHECGVLHRDLKPSNIMLGTHGETLVVDWGLAKLTQKDNVSDHQLAVTNIVTESQANQTLPGSIVGTPGFMSPEQAEGRIDELNPGTDIYGLGATLFFLLTGRKAIPNGQIDEILERTIQVKIPEPRSVLLKVPKPVNAICRKAMACSPKDRYTNCETLAEDIENFLAGEPVAAYTEPLIDRSRRWVRKHRILASSAIVAIAVSVVGLAIGLAVVARLNQELDEKNNRLANAIANEKDLRVIAEEKEQEAVQQSLLAQKRLVQAHEVASELLFSVDRKLKNVPAASAVRRELLNRAERLLESLLVEAANDPVTRRLRAVQLMISGNIARQYENLHAAKNYYTESLAIYRQIAESDPYNDADRANLTISLFQLARCVESLGNLNQAKKLLLETQEIQQELVDANPEDADHQLRLAATLMGLGEIAKTEHHLEIAEDFYRSAVSIYSKQSKIDPNSSLLKTGLLVRRGVRGSLRFLEDLARDHNNQEVARTFFDQSQRFVLTKGRDDLNTLTTEAGYALCLNRLGGVSRARGDSLGARLHFEKALGIYRLLSQIDQQNTEVRSGLAFNCILLGNLAKTQGNQNAAKRYYVESLDLYRQLALDDPLSLEFQRGLASSLNNLGDIASLSGDLPAAKTYFEESVSLCQSLTSKDSENTEDKRTLAEHLYDLGRVLRKQGNEIDAERCVMQVLEIRKALAAANLNDLEKRRLIEQLSQLAMGALSASDLSTAQTYYEEILDVVRKQRKVNESELAATLSFLGWIKQMRGQYKDSQGQLEESVLLWRKLAKIDQNNVGGLIYSLERLAATVQLRGDHKAAQKYYEEVLGTRRSRAAAEPQSETGQQALAATYLQLGLAAERGMKWQTPEYWYGKGIEVMDQKIADGQNIEHAKWYRSMLVQLLKSTKIKKAAPAVAERPLDSE